jgi:hypothetical protein
MRGFVSAALITAVVLCAPGAAQEPASPFQQVAGDGWIASNAHFDGTNWEPRLAGRPSFGLQLGEVNDIPFERGTAGATFWARDASCSGAFSAFGTTCGWKLALAVTQFRSLVVGGNGIEIDGLNLKPPYGRIMSANDGSNRRFGITNNIFADWSGADVASAPRWFAGFNVDHDQFEIARGMSNALTPLATVGADGALTAASANVERLDQQIPESFATRGHLANGRYVFAFHRPYAHVPVCVASSEGAANIHVISSVAACNVLSANRNDASIVNVEVTGDPN